MLEILNQVQNDRGLILLGQPLFFVHSINMKPDFIQQISNGLKSCAEFCKIQLENSKIACAVSGGADSVSLLLALNFLKRDFNFELSAISVNHNLRGAESLEDLKYVESLCAQLNVSCISVTIPYNQIYEISLSRKGGIEEAARFVRYREFERIAAENDLSFIALAHNKNDLLENILMRFMQGGVENLGGMKICRPFALKEGFYIRPMIEVPRSDVENFLSNQKVLFRTDSSNLEDNYLRNKIRHKVVPLLDENFDFWQMGVISSAYKSKIQKEAVEYYARREIQNIGLKQEFTDSCKKISFDGEKFSSLPAGVKWNIVYEVLNRLEVSSRFPFARVQEVCSETVDSNLKLEFDLKNGTVLQIKCGKIFEFATFQKDSNVQNIRTKRDFSVIIERTGIYKLGEFQIQVEDAAGGQGVNLLGKITGFSGDDFSAELFLPSLSFPFVIRNRNPGDRIKCSDSTYKNVKNAVAGLKKLEQKSFCKSFTFDAKNVLVIQELSSADLNIVALWGTFAGLCNWIV